MKKIEITLTLPDESEKGCINPINQTPLQALDFVKKSLDERARCLLCAEFAVIEQALMRGMTADVKTIANMQRDLDAYTFSFVNIIGWLDGKFEKTSLRPAIQVDLAASDGVNELITCLYKKCQNIFKRVKELEAEIEATKK